MTNFERIKQMDEIELATFLVATEDFNNFLAATNDIDENDVDISEYQGLKAWFSWLNEEVSEEDIENYKNYKKYGKLLMEG